MTKMLLGNINQNKYITVKTLAIDLPKTTKLLCVRSKRMIWGCGEILHVFFIRFHYAMSSCLLEILCTSVVQIRQNGKTHS